VQQAEAEAAKTLGDLLEERGTLRTRVETLEAEREAMLAPILAADREVYERLRPTKRGRAVSRLDDGNCSACGVAPSSSRGQDARQGNALILCGNCGRILCAD
jgi:predicted  nucleic acid-binding Zn-ribbon protein